MERVEEKSLSCRKEHICFCKGANRRRSWKKSDIYEEVHQELEKLSEQIGGHLKKWNREELYDL